MSSVANPAVRFVLRYRSRNALQYVEDLGNGITLEMLKIPGGTFLMGSPAHELGRYEDVGEELHAVTVPDFFLGKYPITQAQWRAICALPPANADLVLNPNPAQCLNDFQGGETVISADQRPVEYVSWHEATEACARLAQATGRPYCLPSEAQWEYACRAGTTTPFHFGETLTSEVANYDAVSYVEYDAYSLGSQGEYRQETTPVGYFPPNAWGLHDMHGNVWEWCADLWHSHYQGAPTDGSAWIVDAESDARLLRGGSWYYSPGNCRSAVRSYFSPESLSDVVGFRVCCAVVRTREVGLVEE
jgi:formylglycine-generating enzyme required for sulfatase activity